MKNVFLTSFVLCLSAFAFCQQPFEKYGYKVKVATLSKGKYHEFFDQDTVVQIGTVVINTISGKIVGFVTFDTTYSEANLNPELISRWISPDPYANAYYSYSPYSYVTNNPIIYIDSEGGFKIPVHRNITARALDRAGLTNRLFRFDLLSGNTVIADIFGAGEDHHFDGRRNFSEVSATWTKLNSDISKASIGDTKLGGAESVNFGQLLHNVQDFYSHSNYVELFIDYYVQHYGSTPSTTEIPTYDEAVASPAYSDFKKNYLEKNLKTGQFNLNRWIGGNDRKKTNEEGNIHHDQLNKDQVRVNQNYGGLTLFDFAVAVATQHTTNILKSSSGSPSGPQRKRPKHKFVQDW